MATLSDEPPRRLVQPSWHVAVAAGVMFTLIAMVITGQAGANWQRCGLVGAGLVAACLLFNMCCRFPGSPVRADRLRVILYISSAFLVLVWGSIELVAADAISLAGFGGQCAAPVLAGLWLWYFVLPGEVRTSLCVNYGISLAGDDEEDDDPSTGASGRGWRLKAVRSQLVILPAGADEEDDDPSTGASDCGRRLKATGYLLAFALVAAGGGGLGIGAARIVDKVWPGERDHALLRRSVGTNVLPRVWLAGRPEHVVSCWQVGETVGNGVPSAHRIRRMVRRGGTRAGARGPSGRIAAGPDYERSESFAS